MLYFVALSGDGDCFDEADPRVVRRILGTVWVQGKPCPNGPTLCRLPDGRWILLDPEGGSRELTPRQAARVFADHPVMHWEWNSGQTTWGISEPDPCHLVDGPPEALADDLARQRNAPAPAPAPADATASMPEAPAAPTPNEPLALPDPIADGKTPAEPIEATIRALDRSPESVRLIRYLADRPNRTATLDEIAKAIDNARNPKARRQTIRQRCNRARGHLEEHGCPVRLTLDRCSITLSVAEPSTEGSTRASTRM